MPGRIFNSGDYRYGFNGKEMDDEVKGSSGTQYDYGFRIYDPRLGRFLSVDPLFQSFPWLSPYQFAGNMPIRFIDLDGLETYDIMLNKDNTVSYIKKISDKGDHNSDQVYYTQKPGQNKERELHPENIDVGGKFSGQNVKEHIAMMESGEGAYQHKGGFRTGESRIIVPQPRETPKPPVSSSAESPSSTVRNSNPLKIGEIPVAPGSNIMGARGSQNYNSTTGALGDDAMDLVNQIANAIRSNAEISSVKIDVNTAVAKGSFTNSQFNSYVNAAQKAKENIMNLLKNSVPSRVDISITSESNSNVYTYPANSSPEEQSKNHGISFEIK